uniref:Retrovirus-related Pol polyprotein from transposon TNT 1-94 n=1 Tax=Tanacetum cinerariifolium TaxID=118510 RepID=A0A699I0M9_TANCI|nr:retrovirus-related Pol polyprotein from transposon TNT 1-94 [Tanacetum cinerariifolium]
MDHEVKRLKQIRILIVKVRWNSRRGPKFTWEREDQIQKKYPHLFSNSASVTASLNIIGEGIKLDAGFVGSVKRNSKRFRPPFKGVTPDIAYAVSVVSRYLANPCKNYWEVVKWILKYLRGTANVGLVFGKNRGNYVDITCFVDSDYAKDPDKEVLEVKTVKVLKVGTEHNVTNALTKVAPFKGVTPDIAYAVYDWLRIFSSRMCCKLEGNATTRGGSFNYRGGIYGPYRSCEEAIWLRGLLEELGVELNTLATNCDNQDVIHLSRNQIFHERTKHINVRYQFIIEVLEVKTVKVLKVGTEHNVTDALTKVVPGRKLQHCLELLSVGVG